MSAEVGRGANLGADCAGRCDEPAVDISAVQVALLVIAAALLIYYIIRFLGDLGGGRERFASRRALEIHSRAQEVFTEGGGDATYSDYKKKVPGADPVQYSDVRRLYREGRMTPSAVETIL